MDDKTSKAQNGGIDSFSCYYEPDFELVRRPLDGEEGFRRLAHHR